MRIIVLSDLHYRLPHYDWLVKAAEDVDMVALVGDLADVVNAVPFEAQVVVLEKYLTVLSDKAVVLASSGNHDLDGPGTHGEQVAGWLQGAAGERIHVDGSSVDIDGTRFTICPWWDGPESKAEVDALLERAAGFTICPWWDGPESKAEVDALLERAAVDRPARWVWLYHSPPAGTVLCRDGRREFPDHELAAWIERYQPEIVLCGHIHQAPWLDDGSWHARLGRTLVTNAGKQRSGPIPAHITLDTDAGTAEWFGVYSSETISLTAE